MRGRARQIAMRQRALQAADTTAPTEASATVAANGTALTVVFAEPVRGFAAGANGFALTPSGAAATLTYVSGDDSTSIVFTISRVIGSTETLTLAYTPGVIVDDSGNPLAAFSGAAVTNNSTQVPASLSSATIQTNGTSLNVVYSAAVSGFASGAEGHALTGLSGGATTLTYSSGDGTATIVFTISRTVYSGETGGALAYTPGDIVTVSNALPVAAYSGQSVTNSSTQVSGPSVRNVSTGTLTGGTNSPTLPTRSSGDTLVAVFGFGVDSPPTANTGWTRRISQGSGDILSNLGVYTRQSNGTDNSPLSASVTNDSAYTIFAVQNPATGYDVSGVGTGNDSSIVAPSVTTTATNDVLISAYLRGAGTGSVTPPGGQTATTQVQVGAPTNVTLICGYETLSASGATGTRTATNSSSTQWIGANVAVK